MSLNIYRMKSDLFAARNSKRMWTFVSFCLCVGAGSLLAIYGV